MFSLVVARHVDGTPQRLKIGHLFLDLGTKFAQTQLKLPGHLQRSYGFGESKLFVSLYVFFETGSHYVAQADF
jgi:hypothetical protein